MGNYLEMHCDKRRGRMDIDDIGIEAFIHWNGPLFHLAEKLGMKSMDRHFRGRGGGTLLQEPTRMTLLL